MIRVTVEVLPYGVEQNKHVVGKLVIGNDGTGTVKYGNYAYKISKNGTVNLTVFREGRIFGFQRSQGIWELIRCVLNSVPNLGEKKHGRKD